MHTPSSSVDLSIVTPVYQAESFLDEFHRRASAAAERLTQRYEIVYVNDGSTDGSLAKLRAIQARDPKAVVVDLSRNFGQSQAVRVALRQARGAYVFPIDDDLEEDPEWVVAFFERMKADDADLVVGVQGARRGTLRQRLAGQVFYFLAKDLLGIECTPNIVNARMMTRRFVDALLATDEREFDLSLLCHAIGFRRSELVVTKALNKTSRYSLRRRLRVAESYITTGTIAPLRWIAVCGALAAACAPICLALPISLEARLVLASLWLLAGAGFAALGCVGLYVGKTYHQARGRPVAVVRQIWRAEDERTARVAS